MLLTLKVKIRGQGVRLPMRKATCLMLTGIILMQKDRGHTLTECTLTQKAISLGRVRKVLLLMPREIIHGQKLEPLMQKVSVLLPVELLHTLKVLIIS